MSKGNPHVKLMHLYAEQAEHTNFPQWQYREKALDDWLNCRHRPEWRVNAEYRPKPKSHPHAELMALYAEDAGETERPWERWELRLVGTRSWVSMALSPQWLPENEYRRKIN